jgi:hypothetical protein
VKSEVDEKDLDVLFPFEYVGGGYFRKRGVKTGQSAEMLHGKDAVMYVYKALRNREVTQ